MLIPVLLSGGAGTRLWPLSRELYPKQFLPLVGDHSLFQETLSRLNGLGAEPPIVVCNEEHRFLVAEQLRVAGVPPAAIVLEPVARNTAPAVALAALAALREAGADSDPVLLVLPADHAIADPHRFRQAVDVAAGAALGGHLVTFGLVPTRAETGYGYLRRGAASGPVSRVERFVEKPDAATAAAYLASGEYLWNSGMFVFRAKRYLAELERRAPDIHAACVAAFAAATRDQDFVRLPKAVFAGCPGSSIDVAVMEKTDAAVLVALDAGWNDVGSFEALHEVSPHDAAGNAVRGDVLTEDCRGNYFYSSGRLIAAVGLTDTVVVETPDAILVAPRERAQDVKTLVTALKRAGRAEGSLHREVFRPWGSYDSVDRGERFQVKRLTVNPGQTLSLQMHHHRAEHWIVVAGTAEITCNDRVFLLTENESAYIPIGATHRIRNPGRLPVHLIEVQSGSYLGEDDIVRFEDRYGRTGTAG